MLAVAKVNQRLAKDDEFFNHMINVIPSAQYFRTDEDEEAQLASSKYHKHKKNKSKNHAKQKRIESQEGKRRKFQPALESTNVETQVSVAATEAAEAKAAKEEHEAKQQLPTAKPSLKKSTKSISELRERLHAKLEALRSTRKEKNESGENSTPRAKKRKRVNEKSESSTEPLPAAVVETSTPKAEVEVPEAISYGSLLLGEESTDNNAKKSKKSGGIKNLLKKAEANQKKMEELKNTEEGQALVKAKGLSTAILQASGEKVLDDPKLLRKALKKKEKLKKKSTKEWNQRVSEQSKAKKDKLKQKAVKRRQGRTRQPSKPEEKTKRAGFEGKNGEKSFLNAKKDKK